MLSGVVIRKLQRLSRRQKWLRNRLMTRTGIRRYAVAARDAIGRSEHVVQQIDWDLALIQKYNYSGPRTPRTRPRWSFQKTSANRRFSSRGALS